MVLKGFWIEIVCPSFQTLEITSVFKERFSRMFKNDEIYVQCYSIVNLLRFSLNGHPRVFMVIASYMGLGLKSRIRTEEFYISFDEKGIKRRC